MSRIVVVTGAAQGIGFAIAKAFVANGDFVAVGDLNFEAAEAAASILGNAKGYKLDVTNEDSVVEFYKNLLSDKGTVDVVVNNAGLQFISSVEDFPIEKWNLLINVMLTGPFLMSKHALPEMKKKKWGRIIHISSAHGKMPDAYKSAYCAAKYGILGLSAVTALETAKDGITVNSVLPGPVRTDLIEKQLPKLAERDGSTVEEAMNHHILGKQWMKRLLEPEEIADSIVFLASDKAAAITGEELMVTGGM
ncbi:3-hydroxybutyrate dehydrogenase [Proteiniclasticum sp. C24MP]|uniref:3-hydroxybutyrate dehydrogenase n=1 Tax=Proteiniclasticum sp. C24MP TaxID=3374101 RepID=UPI003754E7E8